MMSERMRWTKTFSESVLNGVCELVVHISFPLFLLQIVSYSKPHHIVPSSYLIYQVYSSYTSHAGRLLLLLQLHMPAHLLHCIILVTGKFDFFYNSSNHSSHDLITSCTLSLIACNCAPLWRAYNACSLQMVTKVVLTQAHLQPSYGGVDIIVSIKCH